MWSDSLQWCSAAHIVLILKWVIDAADPGKLPCAQEARRMAATLTFFRTHSIDTVLQAGQ